VAFKLVSSDFVIASTVKTRYATCWPFKLHYLWPIVTSVAASLLGGVSRSVVGVSACLWWIG
jgi:hypothetical protein